MDRVDVGRVGVALAGVLAVLAWWIAWRRRVHRPIAWFVTANLVADLVLWTLTKNVLAPARLAIGAAPYAGWDRVAFHVHQAAFLVWPAGIAAVAVAVFVRRRPWPVLGAFAAAVAGIAAAYPAVRGAALARVYFAAELLALLVAAGAGVTWWWRRKRPVLSTDAGGVLALAQIGVTVHWAPFEKGWDWQATTIVGAYAILTVLHAGEQWFLRRSTSY